MTGLLVFVSPVSHHCPRERGNETWANKRGKITTQADMQAHTLVGTK